MAITTVVVVCLGALVLRSINARRRAAGQRGLSPLLCCCVLLLAAGGVAGVCQWFLAHPRMSVVDGHVPQEGAVPMVACMASPRVSLDLCMPAEADIPSSPQLRRHPHDIQDMMGFIQLGAAPF